MRGLPAGGIPGERITTHLVARAWSFASGRSRVAAAADSLRFSTAPYGRFPAASGQVLSERERLR